MTACNFTPSLALVLKSEGGNDDDPSDNGGRTSRGITQREYDAWRAENGLPVLDVWKAPQADVDAIYHDEYWEPWCDLIPIGPDYMFFDMSVLSGTYRATCLLQRALDVTEDGRIGPITRAAIASSDPKTLILNYTKTKKQFFLGLGQPRFTRGWLNRADASQQAALAMIGG